MKSKPSGRGLSRRSLLVGGLALAGCARLQQPPLQSLYGQTPSSPDQPPLIFIPGAFGSRLRDPRTRQEVWPGSNMELLFGTYDDLGLAIDADALEPVTQGVTAHAVFKDGLGRDFYGAVMRTLERAGGYRRRRPGEPVDARERNYYAYLYDWRLDNTMVVEGLHDLIEQIRADYQKPDLKVDILAHSNGGLLARYYARYGTAQLSADAGPDAANPGADRIRRLILVGTPNLGTVQPVLSHLRGEEIGLRKIRPEVIATCPGAMQLLPHPCVDWLINLRGDRVARDVFSIDTWKAFRWSIFDPSVRDRIIATNGGGAAGRRYIETLERYFDKHLQRGRHFIEALATPAPATDVSAYVFGGDCAPTLARLVLERKGRHLYARERVADITSPKAGVDYQQRMFEPGDLVVTRNSLLGRASGAGIDDDPGLAGASLAIRHSVFLCENHQKLTGNPSFQDNLLYTLLSR